MIRRMIDFIRKERLYFLLVVFMVILNIAVVYSPAKSRKAPAKDKAGHKITQVKKAKANDDLKMSREEVEKIFKEKQYLMYLFAMTTMLILAVLMLGIIIDGILISIRLSGKRPDITTIRQAEAKWGIWDVLRVVILFMFFGYIVVIAESALATVFPVIKHDNFRMMVNSSILDVLAIILIVYFSVWRHRESLTVLGISLKNFTKNVFYGIVTYISIVPSLIAALVLIAVVSNFLKYVPERQPVVDLFLKEKDPAFLIYTGIFAAIIGPVMEELFFRAFMYKAFKKYVGFFWAMVITSIFFAALHAHLVGFLPIMMLGMALVYIYEKTGSIISSITVHAMHNFSMVFMVFMVKQLVK